MLRTRIIAGTKAAVILSAVFACFVTLTSRVELFIEPFRVDPERPAPITLRLPPTSVVRPGPGGEPELVPISPVVARGERAPEAEADLVRAYEGRRRPARIADLLGLFGADFLIALVLILYAGRVSPGRGALLRVLLGLFGLAFGLLAGSKALLLYTPFPPHALPLVALPIWAAFYIDRRTAIAVTFAMAFLGASLGELRPSGIAVHLVGGLAALAILKRRKRRSWMIAGGALAGISGAAAYVAAEVIFDGAFDFFHELAQPLRSPMIGAAAGGLAGGLMAYLLEGPAARILDGVTRARLQELADLDEPLLQKMIKEAPGSWEHSRAMANLAEAAVSAIGGDALLTRVGAYYHDLGKSIQPNYFVENLRPGEPSPHKDLDPDLSADAIVAHVVEGVNILRKGGLPEPIVEFAYTHHGTSVIEYFWHKCLEQGNPRDRAEHFFRYPGMRPRTKETAILMLVDSIEAASRTIDPPERELFAEMVRRIVFVKMRQGQLDHSPLSMEELRIVINQIIDTLCSMYHSRIRYPWQDKKEGDKDLPMPGVATEEEVVQQRLDSVELSMDEEDSEHSDEVEENSQEEPSAEAQSETETEPEAEPPPVAAPPPPA